MTMRHRQALWYGDPAKQQKLLDILRDPVLCEAIDLYFAESRTPYPDSRDMIPDLLMARRQAETGGVECFLQALDKFTQRPAELPQETIQEWDHMVPDFHIPHA